MRPVPAAGPVLVLILAAPPAAGVELVAGGKTLARKVRRYRPAVVAFLGVTAYRTAFGRKDATIGLQAETIADSRLWVLPNPSGLNAHYQLKDLASLYNELRRAVRDGGR